MSNLQWRRWTPIKGGRQVLILILKSLFREVPVPYIIRISKFNNAFFIESINKDNIALNLSNCIWEPILLWLFLGCNFFQNVGHLCKEEASSMYWRKFAAMSSNVKINEEKDLIPRDTIFGGVLLLSCSRFKKFDFEDFLQCKQK